MARPVAPNDPASLLRQAMQLLGQRKLPQAEACCREALQLAPRNAEALHLLGLVRKEMADFAGGEQLLRESITVEPRRAEFRVNLANLLRRRGQMGEARETYRSALAIDPGHRVARLGLARVLNDLREYREAEAECRTLLASNDRDSEALAALGASLREQHRLQESESAYRRAISIDPDYAIARHNLGALLSQTERAEEALSELERAGSLGLKNATLAVNIGRTMLQLYRLEDAERAYAFAVRLDPRNTDAQLSLAQLRHMRGDPDFARDLAAARAANPGHSRLDMLHADVLRRTGDLHGAESLLRNLLARHGGLPEISYSLALVLQERGELAEAELHALDAAALKPHDTAAVEALVSIQLARAHADEAAPFIRAMRERFPHEQRWIAYDATRARVAGDSLYDELYDYDRLVQVYDIEAPKGWSNVAALNADVAAALEQRHRFASHPFDQSLRNGSQTARSLIRDTDVAIQALLSAFQEPIRHYRERMGTDPAHPLSARNQGEARMQGCWSVQLKREGYHVNHLHPEGWISSAYYVSVPGETADMTLVSGWLKFGEPRFPVPGAVAARFVQPKPGRLALFPSYMWHGTTPIHGAEPRTTVAFDVVPDAKGG